MNSWRCLIIAACPAMLMLAGCGATNQPVMEPVAPVSQQPSARIDLPVELPTYFLPEQNPVQFNPAPFLGTVYVSTNDRYFHRADCPKLAHTNTPLRRQEAQVRGYSPCPGCKP